VEKRETLFIRLTPRLKLSSPCTWLCCDRNRWEDGLSYTVIFS